MRKKHDILYSMNRFSFLNYLLIYLIFLGHTEDLNEMINNINVRYPTTKLVCIGYSMGGNIVTKYLGEHGIKKSASIIGGVSICQGYDIIRSGWTWSIIGKYRWFINNKLRLFNLGERSGCYSGRTLEEFIYMLWQKQWSQLFLDIVIF